MNNKVILVWIITYCVSIWNGKEKKQGEKNICNTRWETGKMSRWIFCSAIFGRHFALLSSCWGAICTGADREVLQSYDRFALPCIDWTAREPSTLPQEEPIPGMGADVGLVPDKDQGSENWPNTETRYPVRTHLNSKWLDLLPSSHSLQSYLRESKLLCLRALFSRF